MTDSILPDSLRNQLKSRFVDIDLKSFKKVVIISSYLPHSVTATSILCRAALRAKFLFHVTFCNPIIPVAQAEKYYYDGTETLILSVGVNVIGKPSNPDCFLPIGGTFYPKTTSIKKEPVSSPAAVEACAFGLATMDIEAAEVALAAIGSLLQDASGNEASKIIQTSVEEGLLAPRKGFKIPGFNFLTLDEVFTNNIYPYLDSLSGNPEACQKIFDDAGIRFSKWRSPLSELASDEARQLNGVLLPSLHPSVVEHILGNDYEFLLEPRTSPLRYLSSISSLARMAWSRQITGVLLSVLIGDRARSLSDMISEYRRHCKETISDVAKLNILLDENDGSVDISSTYVIVDTRALSEHTLADVGRIALDSNITKECMFVIMVSEGSTTLVWKKPLTLFSVSAALFNRAIEHSSVSARAVRIPDTSADTHETIIEALTILLKEA